MRRMEWRRGILIGAMLLICAWLASLIWGLAGKTHIAVSQAGDARAEFQELEDRKASLQANLAALNTPRGQDAAIRTAFGVARPGEEVIVVVPPAEATATPPMTWWQKLFSWF